MFERLRKGLAKGLIKIGKKLAANSKKTKQLNPIKGATYIEPAELKKPKQPVEKKESYESPVLTIKEKYSAPDLGIKDIHKDVIEVVHGNGKKSTTPNITVEERKMLKDAFLSKYDMNNLSNMDKKEIIEYLSDLGYKHNSRMEWYEEMGLYESLDDKFDGLLKETEKDEEFLEALENATDWLTFGMG